MKKRILSMVGFNFLLAGAGSAATLTALTSFGTGGILLPAAYGGSALAGGTERSFAYNAATDNLVLVSRNGSNAVRTTASRLSSPTVTPTIVDPTTGSANGAFRLSAVFVDNDTVIGNQNGITGIADFSGSAISNMTALTLATPASERHVDTIQIGGKTYLATLDSLSTSERNTVRIYELNGSAASLQASLNLIGTASGAGQSNANGTGDIEWGRVTGDSATLYSLTTNYGIQAFTFTVPEPSSTLLGVLGLGLMLRRRRR